jgi:hypothetical protein
MTIRYTCEECGAALNIKDELAGTSGRCPCCKAEFVVPSASKSGDAVAAAAPAQRAAELSEDDIESILEGKSGDGGDAYRVKAPAEDERETPPDEHEDLEEAARRARQKKRMASPPVTPAVSSAGIARNLMGRADKGAAEKVEAEEITERKPAARPFGGAEGEEDDAGEGFSAREIAIYVGKWAAPVAVALVIGWFIASWWMTRWKRGDLPPLGRVTGVVTLDGVPLAGAEVQFSPVPVDPRKPDVKGGAASFAFTDAQGAYRLTYLENVEGAVVGKHTVQIRALGEDGMERVPARYNSRSRVTVEVKEGRNEHNFAVESPTEEPPVEGGFEQNPGGS